MNSPGADRSTIVGWRFSNDFGVLGERERCVIVLNIRAFILNVDGNGCRIAARRIVRPNSECGRPSRIWDAINLSSRVVELDSCW